MIRVSAIPGKARGASRDRAWHGQTGRGVPGWGEVFGEEGQGVGIKRRIVATPYRYETDDSENPIAH